MKIKGLTLIPGSLAGLDPDFAKRWIDQLENGGLTQIKRSLHTLDADGFCCLGVACEIGVADGIVEPFVYDSEDDWEEDRVSYGSQVEAGDAEYNFSSISILPRAVISWYGFPSSDPTVAINMDGGEFTLSGLNDDRDFSFSDIAQVIRFAIVPVDES